MKLSRYFVSLTLFSVVVLVAGCGVLQQQPEAASSAINQQQKPTPALQELLTKCDMTHDGTLADIVAQTQKAWLRPAGLERFHVNDAYTKRKEEFHPLFVRLGLIDEVMPQQKWYRYAVVHGANVLVVRARLAYLAKIWQAGVRFQQLVFLTGQRILDPVQETEQALCDRNQDILPIRSDWQYDRQDLPTNETEMMRFIYEQAAVPAELRAVPLTVIDAPQIIDDRGNTKRPNTQSTIHEWLKTNPEPGRCLAISNQPFVGYQDSVMRTELPAGFDLETVGLALPSVYESVALCLDSLARWLYQENIRRNLK